MSEINIVLHCRATFGQLQYCVLILLLFRNHRSLYYWLMLSLTRMLSKISYNNARVSEADLNSSVFYLNHFSVDIHILSNLHSLA